MSWIDGVRSVARALLLRDREERELAEEVEFHLDMETEKLVRAGHEPAAARRLARLRFGGVDRMSERAREERGTRWIEEAWTDLRYGWRSLRRSPLFAATAILTLGVGIGATSAVYTLVDGVLLRPLALEEPSRLVELRELGDGRRFFPSYPNFADWRDASESFDGLLAVRPPSGPQPVLDAGDPTVVPTLGIGRGFLAILGVEPFLGRDFTADENAPGGPDVALVSHRFWSTRLGADPDLERLGFTFVGARYRVVGVLPPGFRFLYDADVYYPDERWPNTVRSSHAHRVFGRLAAGVTAGLAGEELDRIAAGINERYPGESQAERVEVRPLGDVILGGYRRPLRLLLAASAFVLLLACANLAGTMLARGAGRRHEVSIRASLGAGRRRIVRQLLTESLLLAGLGAALGIAGAYAAVRLAAGLDGSALPRLGEVHVGARTLLVTAGTAALTALAIGAYPALRLVGSSASITASGTRGSSERGGRVWSVLLAGEAAIAVVLLAGAALLVQSLFTIVRDDRGWDPDGVLMMSVTMPGGVFESQEEAISFAGRLREELAALPGVDVVGVGTYAPLDAGYMTAPAREAGTEPRMDNYTGWRLVDGAYFRALGIRLLRGRLLEPDDRYAGVVNASLARFLWGDEDPIGKRVLSNYDFQGEPIVVVGVVEDARDWRWEAGSQTELFVPWWNWPSHIQGPLRYFLRTGGDPGDLVSPARARLRGLNARVPAEFETLRASLDATVADRRFVASVLLAFAAAGLLLALVGVFGVVSYTVARQRREIGIRMALGAARARVRGEMRSRALYAVALGTALGAVVVLAGGGVVEALLYEVPPRDPVTLTVVVLTLLTTAFVASDLPARRATRVEPTVVLKE